MKYFLLITLLLIPLLGCEEKPSAQNCINKKREQRTILNGLYADYRKEDVVPKAPPKAPPASQAPTQKPSGTNEALKEKGKAILKDLEKGFDAFTEDIEIELFEKHCIDVGHAKRVSFVTEKTRVFFNKPNVKDTCAKVVNLEVQIKNLELQFPACAAQ